MNEKKEKLTHLVNEIDFSTVGVQDGTIDKNDLRGAFDNVGVLMTESELDELLGEVAQIYLSNRIENGSKQFI